MMIWISSFQFNRENIVSEPIWYQNKTKGFSRGSRFVCRKGWLAQAQSSIWTTMMPVAILFLPRQPWPQCGISVPARFAEQAYPSYACKGLLPVATATACWTGISSWWFSDRNLLCALKARFKPSCAATAIATGIAAQLRRSGNCGWNRAEPSLCKNLENENLE